MLYACAEKSSYTSYVFSQTTLLCEIHPVQSLIVTFIGTLIFTLIKPPSNVASRTLNNELFSKILDKYYVETREQEYVFAYFSFGLVAIIEKWIEKDCVDDINMIANIMKNVIGYQK